MPGNVTITQGLALNVNNKQCKTSEAEEQLADEESRKLYEKYVFPRLHALKTIDTVGSVLSATLFVFAVVFCVSQANDGVQWYYPLHSSLVQYYETETEPAALTDIVSELNQCTGNEITTDAGPVAIWGGRQFKTLHYPHAAGNFGPWPFTLYVLAVTAIFITFRWMLAVGSMLELYIPADVDLFRWLEYLLTSPVMIVIIATAAGVRDVGSLALLGVTQALLILCGYTIESGVSDMWQNYGFIISAKANGVIDDSSNPIVYRGVTQDHHARKPTKAGPKAGSSTADGNDVKAHQRVLLEAHLIHNFFVQRISTSALSKKWGDLCDYRTKSVLPLIKFRIAVFLIVAWVAFAMQWWVILTAVNRLVSTFNECSSASGELAVPAFVTPLVWIEMILFASFGLVQTWQVLESTIVVSKNEDQIGEELNRRTGEDSGAEASLLNSVDEENGAGMVNNYKIFYRLHVNSFLTATYAYTILNIAAKGVLGFFIIAISLDMTPDDLPAAPGT